MDDPDLTWNLVDYASSSPPLSPVQPNLPPPRPLSLWGSLFGDNDDYEPFPSHVEPLDYLTPPQHGSDEAVALSDRSHRAKRHRMDLPMIIDNVPLTTRPDSGSEDNILTVDLVSRLSLPIDASIEHLKAFKLANGTTVKALGRVTLACAFMKDTSVQLICVFYVLRHLIHPIIMGMAFLSETETLSKHRHRLQPRSEPMTGPLQVCSLSSPTRRLLCIIDPENVLANADTGSEIDLISSDYARRRGFNISAVEPYEARVQLADGTIALLEGKVSLQLSVGHRHGPSFKVIFYVMQGLTCDLLLGEDILDETDAFQTHGDALSIEEGDDIPGINTILWLNVIERVVSRSFGSPHRADRDPHEAWDQDDARENHRREMAKEHVAAQPESLRPQLWHKEQEKIMDYEVRKANRDQPGYNCDEQGCNVAPFKTRGRLISHRNLHHDETRPHFCPIEGCPRAKGGKGFKRKNELIRHGLVHQSPGYVCPFYPERELKYPRPDNLQRHVRVCHSDVSVNDPRLQDAFKRPEISKSGGRRRRLFGLG